MRQAIAPFETLLADGDGERHPAHAQRALARAKTPAVQTGFRPKSSFALFATGREVYGAARYPPIFAAGRH